MFGYACRETPELMPLPIMLAHRLTRQLSRGAPRGSARLPAARRQEPGDGRVRRRPTLPGRHRDRLGAAQHAWCTIEILREDIQEKVIEAVRPAGAARRRRRSTTSTRPAASWSADRRATAGSPGARSSSTPTAAWAATAAAPSRARTRRRSTARPPTWRGTWRRTWSRRDSPTKVRAAGRLRDRRRRPGVDHGRHDGNGDGGRGRDRRRRSATIFPLTPKGIIEYLDLRRPIFRKTAAYGHFGRSEPEFTWEQTNKAAELKAWFKR